MSLTIASIALYGAGVTSTLSPCALPLVPGYLAVLVDDPSKGRRARPQRVAMFAMGAIGTFVLLGGLIGWAGLTLDFTIGWLQRLTGIGLVCFGLLMIAGRLGRLTAEFRFLGALPAQRHLRALLLGVGCGAAWTPCVGPLLGAALTAAARSGSTLRGSLLLLMFGCGVLTPFCAVSFVRVPKLGSRVSAVGRRLGTVSACVMLVLGVLLVGGWYDAFIGTLDIGTKSRRTSWIGA